MHLQTHTQASKATILSALPDDDTLLTSGQTRARVGGVSQMCIWRWMRDDRVKFPEPATKINGRNYWRLGDLRRWQVDRTQKQAA